MTVMKSLVTSFSGVTALMLPVQLIVQLGLFTYRTGVVSGACQRKDLQQSVQRIQTLLHFADACITFGLSSFGVFEEKELVVTPFSRSASTSMRK